MPLAGYLGALTDPRNVDLITFNPSLAQLNSIIGNAANGLQSLTTIPYDPATDSRHILVATNAADLGLNRNRWSTETYDLRTKRKKASFSS